MKFGHIVMLWHIERLHLLHINVESPLKSNYVI